MSGLADYDLPPLLRTVDQAKKCIYLGPVLTEEEVERYKADLLAGGIPCRSCDKTIPGHHCRHEQAGPFTRIAGKCTSCVAFVVV